MVRRELPAAAIALLAALVLLGLTYIGSRGLRDFDSALIGYAVGSARTSRRLAMELLSGPGTTAELSTCLDQLARLHPRLCPRQVLGVRMGLLAGEILGLDLPRRDKRLLVLVETDGCFADGLSVATGCWLGRRTLRLVDHGRVAATLVDTSTTEAVRLRPHPQARMRGLSWAPHAADEWHAQLIGYQLMPSAELLQVESVTLTTPLEQILGRPGVRVTCVACGEEVLNSRELRTPAGPLCAACAGRAYYDSGSSSAKGSVTSGARPRSLAAERPPSTRPVP
jgi:formylmethanofuran dehydrogenase subunit E